MALFDIKEAGIAETVSLTEALADLHAEHLDQAEAKAQLLLSQAPTDPVGYQLLATIALRRGRYSEAVRWACSCLALSPKNLPVLLIAGKASRACGNYAEAMKWFRLARETAPDRPEPAFLLCVSQLQCGDPAAQATLEDILRSFPDDAGGAARGRNRAPSEAFRHTHEQCRQE